MSDGKWNPRFVAFARSLGMSPESSAAGAPFILWITARWTEWGGITGRVRPYSEDDHRAFDAWLAST